jgi:hypothetical protein
MLTLLSLAFTAQAASNELSVELAWFSSSDPSFQYFSGGTAMPAFGLRGGFAVHPNITIIAGYRGGATGGSVSGGGEDTYDSEYYYGGGDSDFDAAIWAHQASVGAKADFKIWKWLHPYAAVQGVGSLGMIRLDDQPGDDENLTQVERIGFTGGFNTALGLDFPIKIRDRWAIAPYLEMGYEWLAPMQFEELGSVQFSGFSGAAGVGVRF